MRLVKSFSPLAVSAAALLAFGSITAAQAAPSDPITVDGNLSADWGIVVGNNNVGGMGTTVPAPASYTPYPSNITAGAFGLLPPLAAGSPIIPAPGGTQVNPFREDTADNAPTNFFVGPEYGGQDYDVEYMFVAMKTGAAGTLANSKIYVAIVSGLRPDNGSTLYAPGDIRINPLTNNALNKSYGIEVGGGGLGCGSVGCGANQANGATGSTYTLDGNGYTQSAASNSYQVGEIVENPTWGTGVAAAGSPKTQMLSGGTQVDADASTAGTQDATMVDNWLMTAATNQHSVIELKFDAGFLAPYLDANGNLAFSISWGPVCGNDIGEMTLVLASSNEQTPEPGTLAIFGMGLAGLGIPAWRRRRAQRAA